MKLESSVNMYRRAYQLSLFTIFYNILEGVASLIMGIKDETLTLIGFGADSFIEVISGLGIAVMIIRIRNSPESPKRKFETDTLKITGSAFYLLSAGLLADFVINLITHHKPETTFWGVIIAIVSILVMTWLAKAKMKVGKELTSEPVIADSKCTQVCIYMSIVLLVSSLLYEITGFAYADAIGAAGLIWFSVSEGGEAFEKAKGKGCS